jgi:catalase
MEGVPLFIKQRHVRACHNADPEYGDMLASALKIDLDEALVAEDPAHPSWDKRATR